MMMPCNQTEPWAALFVLGELRWYLRTFRYRGTEDTKGTVPYLQNSSLWPFGYNVPGCHLATFMTSSHAL